jgi:chorismate synthase
MNSFGKRFKFTTFGESHGVAIGCIVEGVPAGLEIDKGFIQKELDRRKPGQSDIVTQRAEDDRVQILSGIFQENQDSSLISTGTPISMVIYNKDQKSKDYSNIKDIFRPSHADFTYYNKYGVRDYRGGGRSSARETAARVAAGAIAKLILNQLDIKVESGVASIGDIEAKNIDFEYAKTNKLYTLDKDKYHAQEELIQSVKNSHDSIGASVLVKITNAPIGLGEPMYYKLDSALGDMMMGLNGVKAVEIGDGVTSSKHRGSEFNDGLNHNGFLSNHSGGILGGISNGDDIVIKVHFKPTPSISQTQQTIDTHNSEVEFNLKGRHDPCIGIRGSVVAESMSAIVVADMLLLNMSSKIDNLKKVYNTKKEN